MKQFKQALLKFEALSLRERLMTVAATLVVLFFLTDFALLGPQRNRNKALQQQIAQQKIDLDGLISVVAVGAADKTQGDALAKVRGERDDLRARMAQAEAFLGQSAKGATVSELIRIMIDARPDLTLVSLKTLPAEVFFKPAVPPVVPAKAAAAAQPAAAAPQMTLYKHGVEVAIKGTYPALLSYLQSLQNNPNKIFWPGVKLDVATYPEATLRMTIYTLSDHAESPLG